MTPSLALRTKPSTCMSLSETHERERSAAVREVPYAPAVPQGSA